MVSPVSEYTTRNQHVAVFCVYAGLALLEVKKVGPKSLQFVLDDPDGEGPELDRQFFEDGSVASSRELLRAADEVRRAVRDMYTKEINYEKQKQQHGL